MTKYKEYVGVDATMADFNAPGMYGAYHHITVLGKRRRSPYKKI
jgi:diaminopimelate decarboxylase